jgi:D-tyrosyl-tRNA(Tyr) deacylase
MRLVVQRAATAEVRVAGEVVGAIDRVGLVILVGVTRDDTPAVAERMADKVWRLRIFDDEKSAEQLAAPMLVVSQFTLYADTRKGRRPSWNAAAPRSVSEPLVQSFVQALRALGAEVATGIFGAHMQVQLINDGPVTLILDSAAEARSVSPP